MPKEIMPPTVAPANGKRNDFYGNLNDLVSSNYYSYKSAETPVQSKIFRVSANYPCPICRKPDWCGVTDDGILAFCQRISDGCVKVAKNQAFIHVLDEGTFNKRFSKPTKLGEDKKNKLIDVYKRNVVYTSLLENWLCLAPHHGNHLLNVRGLSDAMIASKLYASTPESCLTKAQFHNQEFVQELAAQFDGLGGIPGFYRENGVWKLRLVGRGLFVPVRDVLGRILSLQVRLENNDKSKYIWLSTPPEKFVDGTGATPFAHYAKPDLVKQTSTAYLTEGPLKADRIAEFTDLTCIAVPGVTSIAPEKLVNEFRQYLPDLAKIYIAFDADWQVNAAVKRALMKMISTFEGAKFNVLVRTWNNQLGKGLDDVLHQHQRGNS